MPLCELIVCLLQCMEGLSRNDCGVRSTSAALFVLTTLFFFLKMELLFLITTWTLVVMGQSLFDQCHSHTVRIQYSQDLY